MNYKNLYASLFLIAASTNIINANIKHTEEKIRSKYAAVAKRELAYIKKHKEKSTEIIRKIEAEEDFNQKETAELIKFFINKMAVGLTEIVDLDTELTPLEQELIEEGLSPQEAYGRSAAIGIAVLSKTILKEDRNKLKKLAQELLSNPEIAPILADAYSKIGLAMLVQSELQKNEFQKLGGRLFARNVCLAGQLYKAAQNNAQLEEDIKSQEL